MATSSSSSNSEKYEIILRAYKAFRDHMAEKPAGNWVEGLTYLDSDVKIERLAALHAASTPDNSWAVMLKLAKGQTVTVAELNSLRHPVTYDQQGTYLDLIIRDGVVVGRYNGCAYGAKGLKRRMGDYRRESYYMKWAGVKYGHYGPQGWGLDHNGVVHNEHMFVVTTIFADDASLCEVSDLYSHKCGMARRRADWCRNEHSQGTLEAKFRLQREEASRLTAVLFLQYEVKLAETVNNGITNCYSMEQFNAKMTIAVGNGVDFSSAGSVARLNNSYGLDQDFFDHAQTIRGGQNSLAARKAKGPEFEREHQAMAGRASASSSMQRHGLTSIEMHNRDRVSGCFLSAGDLQCFFSWSSSP